METSRNPILNATTMTATSALPPPTLPLNVVELILAFTPMAKRGATAPLSLLNVVSPQLVPSAVGAIIIGCFFPSSRFLDPMSEALRRLFDDASWDSQSKLVLRSLKRALELDTWMCVSKILPMIASAGNVILLQFFDTKVGRVCEFDESWHVIHLAAVEGRLNVFEWWVAQGYSLEILEAQDIAEAVRNRHLSVLYWWSDLNLPKEFDFSRTLLLQNLIQANDPGVTYWWKQRFGLDNLVFTDDHWVMASRHVGCWLLEFAKENGFVLPFSTVECIDEAASNGCISVLDWWLNTTASDPNCTFDYSVAALDNASANGHVQVLDYFAKSGLELRFTPAAVQLARDRGHADVVKWWDGCRLYKNLLGRSGPLAIQLRQPADFVMLCAFGFADMLTDGHQIDAQSARVLLQGFQAGCRFGHVTILEALQPAVSALVPSNAVSQSIKSAIECAVENNHSAVVQWCLQNVLPVPFNAKSHLSQAMDRALERGYISVLEVLRCSGHFDPSRIRYHIGPVCRSGQVSMLDFLSQFHPVVQWDSARCEEGWHAAAINGHIAVLDWLLKNSITPCTNPKWIDEASANGHYLVLEWWDMNDALEFKFTELALWRAVKNERKQVIRWWIRSGRVKGKYMLEMLQNALDELSK